MLGINTVVPEDDFQTPETSRADPVLDPKQIIVTKVSARNLDPALYISILPVVYARVKRIKFGIKRTIEPNQIEERSGVNRNSFTTSARIERMN